MEKFYKTQLQTRQLYKNLEMLKCKEARRSPIPKNVLSDRQMFAMEWNNNNNNVTYLFLGFI